MEDSHTTFLVCQRLVTVDVLTDGLHDVQMRALWGAQQLLCSLSLSCVFELVIMLCCHLFDDDGCVTMPKTFAQHST